MVKNYWIFLLISVIVIISLSTILYFLKFSEDASINTVQIPSSVKNLIQNNNMDIITLFENNSNLFKNDIALLQKKYDPKVDNWIDTVTFSNYYSNALNYAKSISSWIGDEQNIAIIGSNNPIWFYFHLGAMINNGVSVGLYPTYGPDTCEYIINHSDAKLLVVDGENQLAKFIGKNISNIKLIVSYIPISEKIKGSFSVPVICVNEFLKKKTNVKYIPNIDRNATFIYTSGTTGNPKCVAITHKNIMAALKGILSNIMDNNVSPVFGIKETFLSYLPLNHILAQMMDIYIPIASAGKVWFAEPDSLKGSLKYTLKEVRPTIFSSVPRVWEKIKDGIEDKLNSFGWKKKLIMPFIKNRIITEMGLDRCRLCMTAGAPMMKDVSDYFEKIGLRIYDIYGMSETAGAITMSFQDNYKKGSVGKPLSSVSVKISDDGEILVKGDQVFKEYYKEKDENQFIEDWFKTGDLGHLDSDGFLFITGRKKELIITSGGENISPVIIEDAIKKELPIINYSVIIGDKKNYLVGLLVLRTIDDDSDLLHADIVNIDSNTKTIYDTSKSAKLKNHIQKAIDRVNKNTVSNATKVQKWVILQNHFKIGSEVTPTLKLKRKFIEDKYKQIIADLYNK